MTAHEQCCCRIKLRVHEQTQRLKLNMEQVRIVYADLPEYEGEYTAVPSAELQVFPTKNKRLTDDFVVGPIPSNYGLISWNGAILTVS